MTLQRRRRGVTKTTERQSSAPVPAYAREQDPGQMLSLEAPQQNAHFLRHDFASVRVYDDAGVAIPDSLRRSFEAGFGRNFADVRLHVGTNAARITDSLDARAVAV